MRAVGVTMIAIGVMVIREGDMAIAAVGNEKISGVIVTAVVVMLIDVEVMMIAAGVNGKAV